MSACVCEKPINYNTVMSQQRHKSTK